MNPPRNVKADVKILEGPSEGEIKWTVVSHDKKVGDETKVRVQGTDEWVKAVIVKIIPW